MDARAKDGAIRNQVGMLAMSPIGLDEEQNATVDFFGTLKARQEGGGFEGSVFVPGSSHCLNAGGMGRIDYETETLVFKTPHGIDGVSGTLRSNPGSGFRSNGSNVEAVVSHGAFGVRRLTPVECERLQGFPDDYTALDKAADGLRYKALGNSMAVPVIRWIIERIAKELDA
jgi:site-specific DNA-cytosine methylase